MKKRNMALFCALGLACAVQAETMRVQVQSGQVRSAPSFLGEVVTTVAYGQAVETLGVQNAWQQVRTADGKTGWLHTSALTTKRIATQAGNTAVSAGASGDEMALAGKGFSADVEAKFKADNAGIDFTWVDRMAKMNASPSEITRFAKAGGLKQSGGAQ